MEKKNLVHRCKYCGKEFPDGNRLVIHEEHECSLNPYIIKKDEKPFTFPKFVVFATLTVVALALVVISPMILYPFLLGLKEPYNYIALVMFWALILGSAAAVGVVDYIRKRRTR